MPANSWSVQDFFPWISDRTSPTDLQTFQHSLQTHRCWLHHHSFSIVSAMHSVSKSRRTVGFRPCRTWDFPVPQHDWKISDQFWQQFLYSSFLGEKCSHWGNCSLGCIPPVSGKTQHLILWMHSVFSQSFRLHRVGYLVGCLWSLCHHVWDRMLLFWWDVNTSEQPAEQNSKTDQKLHFHGLNLVDLLPL